MLNYTDIFKLPGFKKDNQAAVSVTEYFVVAYNILAVLFILIFFNVSLLKFFLIFLHILIIFFFLQIIKLEFDNLFRLIFPLILVPAFFNELHILIPYTKLYDMDHFLIKLDRLLFLGKDPLIGISQWTYAPVVDVLQIVYASFYLLPFLVILENINAGNKNEILNSIRVIVLGFLISYLGYFLVSALGPRFYLENDFLQPLNGNGFYWFLHHIINDLELINWDAFPSGHTEVALLSALLASRTKLKFKILYWIFAIGIIISTVYLRYHYVSDVLAGIILAACIWRMNDKWQETDMKKMKVIE